MNDATLQGRRTRLSLPRLLTLLLAGAFANLMLEIRVEHVDVVRDHPIAWLPIGYAAAMTLACLVAAILWKPLTRRIMIALFSLGLLIGALGFYLHNRGSLSSVPRISLRAWTDRDMHHLDGPPLLAPLAFAGLGTIGILASLRRFNPE